MIRGSGSTLRSLAPRPSGSAGPCCSPSCALVTKIGLFPQPLPVAAALARVQAWTDQPSAVLVEPTPRHLHVLAGLLVPTGVGGNVVTDAHLAALAVEYDATIVTYDSDFARFAGVRWQPPPDAPR